jgi:hypothetical protein
MRLHINRKIFLAFFGIIKYPRRVNGRNKKMNMGELNSIGFNGA